MKCVYKSQRLTNQLRVSASPGKRKIISCDSRTSLQLKPPMIRASNLQFSESKHAHFDVYRRSNSAICKRSRKRSVNPISPLAQGPAQIPQLPALLPAVSRIPRDRTKMTSSLFRQSQTPSTRAEAVRVLCGTALAPSKRRNCITRSPMFEPAVMYWRRPK